MNPGLNLIQKLHVYIGLAGFVGCVLTFIVSDFLSEKSRIKLETISTFLLGSSFTGVLLFRLMIDHIILNMFISILTGIMTSFVAREFCTVSLKKTLLR
jgi:hypothetical protein